MTLPAPLLLALLACSPDAPEDSGKGPALDFEPGPCNPVDDGHCLLPFPSDFYTVEDPATATGRRVALPAEAMPVNIDGVVMRPDQWNELDGWSTLGEMLAWLPEASLEGVVGWQDLEALDAPDVKTVVVDAATGERIPHFVERDVFAPDSDRQLLVLRPIVPLKHATTYVVGIRGLVDDAGALAPAPAGFAQLRDAAPIEDPALAVQQARYEDLVFPALAAQGFAREELQLAWSYTTTSAEGSLGRARWLRDDALAWAQAQGISYALDSQVQELSCDKGEQIGRTLTGTFQAPLYLVEDAPGSLLTRDADGWPFQNGTTTVPFTVRIPCSVLLAGQPAPVLQFGHGLLGNQGEVYSGELAQLAQDAGLILSAVDWTGMKEQDRLAITTMIIQDPGGFAMIPERLMQGFVEQALLTRLLTGPLSQDPALQAEDGSPLVDPERQWFYGISQGAVLGAGFTGLSVDHDKLVLGVPGMPFTLLLARSDGFLPFLLMLEGLYEDPADVSMVIAMMQHLWDPGEAAGYARFMNQEPLDALTPPKDVLMLAGIGDALVPALGAHIMARSYGAKLILPANRSIWGVPEAEPPFTGSALIEFDFGYEDPVEAVPADVDNAVHWSVTGRQTSLSLIAHWLHTGEAINPCDGPCDPD